MNVYENMYVCLLHVTHTFTRHCCALCVYICVFKLITIALIWCSLVE